MFPRNLHGNTAYLGQMDRKEPPRPRTRCQTSKRRLEQFRDILVHLMAPLSYSGRRVARRDVMHRASGATHPNSLGAPPKAAPQGPVAVLRFLDDAPHRPANRACPRGLGERSNGSEYPGNALAAQDAQCVLQERHGAFHGRLSLFDQFLGAVKIQQADMTDARRDGDIRRVAGQTAAAKAVL